MRETEDMGTDETGEIEHEIEEVLRTWMTEYLAREHPDMPRPGTVCPFVQPALDAGAIEIRRCSAGVEDPSATTLRVAGEALAEFASSTTGGGRSSLRALVLAFPDLIDRPEIIDETHAALKREAVTSGLMIGQFHAACTEPSARNPEFPVNRAPLPLLVLRAMTVHDILFLHSGTEWFREYALRFGHLYEGSHRLDPGFRALYEAARERELVDAEGCVAAGSSAR